MTDIQPEENMWYPGPDSVYKGRQGDYTRSAIEFNRVELIKLVSTRVEEDGEWVLEHEHAGGDEEMMRKMMKWASNPRNIIQCFNTQGGENPTVDAICRELGNAAKKIAEGVRG